MSSAGTNSGDLFRYPYQLDDLLRGSRLEKDSAMLMDRDRALEDYVSRLQDIVGSVGSSIAEGRAVVSGTPQLSIPGVDCLGTTVNSDTLAANELRYSPFYLTSHIEIDQICMEITTAAAAGKKINFGIYDADASWNPLGLVVEAGGILADTIGVKTATVTGQTLTPGRYLTAFNTDGVPTIRGIRGGQRYIGYVPTLGAAAFRRTTMRRASVTYSNNLADPGVLATATATEDNSFRGYVFMRITDFME